jgi:hypothetical protein
METTRPLYVSTFNMEWDSLIEVLPKNVDAATLSRLVEQHEGKTLPLVIWSVKYRNMRGMIPLYHIYTV